MDRKTREKEESLIKQQGLLLSIELQHLTIFSRHAGCAKTLNPLSRILQVGFTPFPQAVPAAALTQYSLPHAPQLHVGCLESFCLLAVQRLLLAVDHDGAAPLQNPLRGTLHHQQEAFVVGVVGLVDGKLCHKQEIGWKSLNCPHLLLVLRGVNALFHGDILCSIKWNELRLSQLQFPLLLNYPIKASRSPIVALGPVRETIWHDFQKKTKHTWNLLVELKGISATFLFCALMLITSPKMTSENFSRAVSEASPTTTLCGHKGRKHFTFEFPRFHDMLHT